MKPRHHLSTRTFLIVIFLAAALLLSPTSQVSQAAPGLLAQESVQQAWDLASDFGAYQFDTAIEQTTFPAPAIANVGRSSHTESYYFQGAVDRAAESLSMMLWQGSGNLVTGQDGFEMHIQDGKAYGRQIGGVWQEIDDFSGLFAPGSDPLAYLAGATNIQQIGTSANTHLTLHASRLI